jgi:hypothetical protein
MATATSASIRFLKFLQVLALVIGAIFFLTGLVILPVGTALRLIGLGVIVAIPYAAALVVGSAQWRSTAVFIVLVPSFSIVPWVGSDDRYIKMFFFMGVVLLVAFPLIIVFRRVRPKARKAVENLSVQA